MTASTLTKSQSKTKIIPFTVKEQNGGILRPDNYVASIKLSYDDNCGNGHNTFRATAVVTRNDLHEVSGACCGTLAQFIPECTIYDKWHLCGPNGPWGYPSNPVFLAGNRDCWGHSIGEPCRWEYGVRFGNFPITYKLNEGLWKHLRALQTTTGTGWLKPLEVLHSNAVADPTSSGFKYGPKYTIIGYEVPWWKCQFDSITEAKEFCDTWNQTIGIKFVEIPVAFSDGKERELDAARRCAIWPDATDEELSVSKEELTAKLEARLPGLLEEFKTFIESLGFVW